MMNQRGTPQSREHMWLSADSDTEFWDYSMEEIGVYDISSCIEFIQNKKNSTKKITTMGYS